MKILCKHGIISVFLLLIIFYFSLQVGSFGDGTAFWYGLLKGYSQAQEQMERNQPLLNANGAPSIDIKADPEVDYSKYKSFSPLLYSLVKPELVDYLTEKNIIKKISDIMIAKGYEKKVSGKADFYIFITFANESKEYVNSAANRIERYYFPQINIQFLIAPKLLPIWNGSGMAITFDPDIIKTTTPIIDKILNEFPNREIK